jgi:uncharacterized protein YegL
MRRLPIFLLLDVSESMIGDNLRQLQQGIASLVGKLRTDPHALETVYLSVIAFAGKVRTLAPLTELAMFYPPHLPVGAGTSLGAALDHLMTDIERTVVKNTAERKGDWRPIVYLMTDGKPTDDTEAAFARWQRDFASRVTLVAIGVGQHAALDTLRQLSAHVLHLQADNEQDFRRFVDWVSMSISAQSRSVASTTSGMVNLAKLDNGIMQQVSAIGRAAHVDADFVIISARCQSNRLPYLIKYERVAETLERSGFRLQLERYHLTGVFALEQDYYGMSDERGLAASVNSDTLIGSPGCPHCGNPIGFAICRCGQVMCLRGPGHATCPACLKEGEFGISEASDGFEVNRSRG